MKAAVGFLFLGETLLIPHLYPIVEALAKRTELPLDLWVSTSLHEELLLRWSAAWPQVRVRRAPGFRHVAADDMNVALPAKLPMLARLLPHLLSVPVVVCAEQTSLWLPTLLPLRTRFVKTSHGVGSMSARDDRRRRSPTLTLVPGERERHTYLDRGIDPDRIVAVGYMKASFRQRSRTTIAFPEPRPVVLYTPHWQPHRSSWPAWGERVVELLASQSAFNIVLAPHQRLVEHAPEVRCVLADVADRPHVHCDLDSFATIDGSYTQLADIYLGDTSSQVVEFMARPRPCVFLNPQRVLWQDDPSFAQWSCGEVVDEIDAVLPALSRAASMHSQFSAVQADYARTSLGDTSSDAPQRAAELVLGLLRTAGKAS